MKNYQKRIVLETVSVCVKGDLLTEEEGKAICDICSTALDRAIEEAEAEEAAPNE